jgi:hypothetical protein
MSHVLRGATIFRLRVWIRERVQSRWERVKIKVKTGFHMVVTVVKIESRSFSSVEINIFELKIRGVIRTREYL